MNDLRYALRSLWKQPGFAAVILLTLTLGIGASSALLACSIPARRATQVDPLVALRAE